ncbi:hypothetical protein PR048_016043 [Dryococelus australis]|uniref:Uncharacterized protein n=1 Tax=Dryococelus australis TaxID=614101 RepID=A0ABQ9HIM4_9NEOP|nr:hypothetical protein PR048_016043 [Dryococelus australis]
MTHIFDENLFVSVGSLALLNTLTQVEFLQCYLSFQKQVSGILKEGHTTDILNVLNRLRKQHPTFVSQTVSMLWILASNPDSE